MGIKIQGTCCGCHRQAILKPLRGVSIDDQWNNMYCERCYDTATIEIYKEPTFFVKCLWSTICIGIMIVVAIGFVQMAALIRGCIKDLL